MLPSLALALLCQPRAGAEVPVQPDLSTEKVTAGGAHPSRAAWGTSPRAAPLGEPGTPGYPWVLSWHQGSFQESFQGGGDAHAKLSWPWQLLPAVARLSGVPTAGTPAPGAVTSPRSRCSPRERGPDAAPGSWHSAGRVFRTQEGGGSHAVGGRSPKLAGPLAGGRSHPFPGPPGGVLLRFAGTWHVAAAVSNCSVFLKMKDGMKSSIVTVSSTSEGELAMKLVWPL